MVTPTMPALGYGATLAFLVAPDGKVHTAMKLIPLTELSVSPYSPDFMAGSVSVSYLGDSSFKIKGNIDGVSLDLNLPVVLPPVTMNQIGSDILANNRITLGMLGAANEMAQDLGQVGGASKAERRRKHRGGRVQLLD